MSETKRTIFEELKSMGVLDLSVASASVPNTDVKMLEKIQEAAAKVTQASESLVQAAKTIQEAVTGFSSLLAEALEEETETDPSAEN